MSRTEFCQLKPEQAVLFEHSWWVSIGCISISLSKVGERGMNATHHPWFTIPFTLTFNGSCGEQR